VGEASSLIITIGGNSDKFAEALKDVKSKTENLQDQLSQISKVSAVAFAALTAEIGLSIAAYKQSEQAVNQLTASLQNQGIYSSKTAKDYQDIATELQNLTGISDESIINAQTVIQGYIGQTKVTKELTLAVANLATAKKMDLASAADLVGKAIDGNTGILKRYGLEISDNLPKSERLTAIMDALNGKFKDQAEAAAQGLGSLNVLKQIFDDFQETLGSRFAPAIASVTKLMISLLNAFKDNKALADVFASLLGAAVALTGLITAASLAGKAFVTLNTIMAIAKIEITATSLAVKSLLGATGLGLLLVVVGEIYLNWSSIWPRMVGVFKAFVVTISEGASALKDILYGALAMNPEVVRQGLAKLKEAFSKGFDEYNTVVDAKLKDQEKLEQDSEDKKLALNDKGAKARLDAKEQQQQREIASKNAQLQLQQMKEEGASSELIALKQKEAEALKLLADDTFKGDKDALAYRAQDLRELQSQQFAMDMEAKREFQDEILVNNEDFQALSDEQQNLFREQYQSKLTDGIETEKSTQLLLAKQRADVQIKANNQFLIDQAKFGVAYATINKAMNSEIVQGMKQAFSDMAEMQNSSNATLKTIGKIAAVANIIIRTNESAMNVVAGFSTIPIIGPALGYAAAAAIYAYGAERVAAVQGAAQGGIVEGGTPGIDSVPFMLQQGELVAPRQNFDEVVNAVADRRNSETSGAAGVMQVIIGFKDSAFEIIEEKILERRALGVGTI
jgi:hypothetical protein